MELETHLPPNTLKSKFVPPLRAIAMAVAQKHGIEFHHLRVKRRLAPLILARGEFVYRALTETTESLKTIGRYLHRHHGTVGYIMRRYCRQYDLPIPRGLKIYERRFRDIHRIKYLRPVGHLDRAERRIFYAALAKELPGSPVTTAGLTHAKLDGRKRGLGESECKSHSHSRQASPSPAVMPLEPLLNRRNVPQRVSAG